MLRTMFERFTDRARRVVVLAQEEARLLGHNYIGTEHILLGLIHEQDGVAAKVLDRLGISLDAVRTKVEAIIGEGRGAPSGHIPFTPRSKKVLELSLREAMALGHNYIGTEHILLGLVREGEGVGATVLVSLGAELDRVRHEVIQVLSGYRASLPGTVSVSGGGFPRPRETPAAAKAGVEARRLAGSAAVGSQHYLLGLLRDENSMAAKALADLGVTRDALEAKLAELKPTGTSDETPEEAGARRINLRVEGKLLILELDDPELAASVEQAIIGRKARIIKGTDPEAAGFPGLWTALSRTVEDLTRRLGKMTAMRGTATAYWRPPGFDAAGHAGGYWVVNWAGGPSVYLEVSPGVDREAVRACMRDWLAARQADESWSEAGREERCATVWFAIDDDDGALRVSSYNREASGPSGSARAPLASLIDAAVDGLSSAV
jgi:ATP-dependent Clp protease ATP-binding subunit ClpC